MLNVVHLGSAFARKNPLAAIAAFRRAFGDAKNRVLVIKLLAGGATRWAERALHEAIAGADNIRLVEGMLPEADMMGLTSAADIVISLHRSEGFGLVPAQAMALGKPVIATGWSGNLEFMTKRNSALVDYSLVPVHDPEGTFGGDGQMWADADVDDATQWLRRLASDARASRQNGCHRGRGHCNQALAQDLCRHCRRPSGPRGASIGLLPRFAVNACFCRRSLCRKSSRRSTSCSRPSPGAFIGGASVEPRP